MTLLNANKFKKALLTGTAVVAVAAFVAPTAAHAANLTLTGNGTWGVAANGLVNPAVAGDNVNLDGNNLTINDTDQATVGAITDTNGTPDGDVTVTTDTATTDVAVTIGSIATGTGNVLFTNLDADNAAVAVTVTGALNSGGTLVLDNTEDAGGAATDDLTATVAGTLTVAGVTTINAGIVAGATATLNADGNTAFTSAVTLTGAAGAGSNAVLTLSGATNTFTGGLVLATAAKSILTVDGTVAQTVTGVISGAGVVNVTNTHASGVTFAGDSTHTGALSVNNDGNNQAVTFTGDNASAIALGDNTGADTITANFSGTTQAISGGITGGGTETVNVNFSGGSTITLSAAASSGIDATAISGSTTVTTNQNFTSTATTIATGSTLAATANTLTTNVTSSGTGTVNLNGGAFAGTIDGGILDVDATGTATGNIGTTTALSSIDVATGADLTVGGTSNVRATTTTLNGTAGLIFAAGAHTVTTNIVATANGDGDIDIADNASTKAFVGDIGTAAKKVGTFDTTGAAADLVTTTGNFHVATTTLGNAADTLQFLGTSAQAVSGVINGPGILTVGNGTAASDVTFSGIVGGGTALASSNVLAGATARFDANATVTGTHTNTGTTRVGVGAVLNAAVLSDTGAYSLKANDANGTLATADFGSLTDPGNNGALTASRVTIDVTGQMTAGAVVLLTGINLGAATLVDNSIQYGFAVADTGNNTTVTVTRATVASLSNSAATVGAGTVLDTLTGSTNTQIVAALANVASAPTIAAVNEVLESVSPTSDGGAVVAGLSAIGSTINITNQQLASLRAGHTQQSGMAAGNGSQGLRAWGQAFGTTGEQDKRDGVDGFDADTIGIAVGLDTETIHEDAVIGVAFSYADTDVDSNNATTTETEVESYQITLYGDYDVDDRTYVSGQVGYVFGNVDSTRHNVGGIAGLTARGDYDTEQIVVRAEVGRDYDGGNGLTITPKILANYVNFSADDYTETGAGGLSLRVDSDDINILEFGVGVEASWLNEQADGSYLEPSLHVGVRQDVIGDEIESTSSFTGGGAAFKTEGIDPASTTFNGGGALTYYTTSNWDLTAAYDFEYKSDYDAHSGVLRAAYKF